MMEVGGIHMVHRGAVAEQRAKDGKVVYGQEAPQEPVPDAPQAIIPTGKARESAESVLSAVRRAPGSTVKDLMEATGFGRAAVARALDSLVALGLVRKDGEYNAEYRPVDGARLPEGWKAEYIPKAKRLPEPYECAMAKALANTRPIDESAVPAYRAMRDFLVKAPTECATGELRDIVDQFIKLCEHRMSSVRRGCPLCGRGQLEKDGATGARCTKCRVALDMGSFSASVDGFRALAGGVRRDRGDMGYRRG